MSTTEELIKKLEDWDKKAREFLSKCDEIQKRKRERLTKRLLKAYTLIVKDRPGDAGYEIRDLIRKIEAGEL